MNVGDTIGVVAAAIGALAVIARILWLMHRGINVIEHLVTRVSSLETTLSNGMRSDVRDAKNSSAEACRLAGKAAQTAAVNQQQVQEMGEHHQRAMNALAATVDSYANAAIRDVAHIWDVLSESGLDRRTE